jgi:hypothetical protein
MIVIDEENKLSYAFTTIILCTGSAVRVKGLAGSAEAIFS